MILNQAVGYQSQEILGVIMDLVIISQGRSMVLHVPRLTVQTVEGISLHTMVLVVFPPL